MAVFSPLQPFVSFCTSHITLPSSWLGPPPPRSADHVFNVHRPRSMRFILSASQPSLLLCLSPPPGFSNHAVHHGLLPSPGRLEPPPSRPHHTSAPERETAAVRLGPRPTGGPFTYFSWLRFTSNTTPRFLTTLLGVFRLYPLFPMDLYTYTHSHESVVMSVYFPPLPPLYVVIPVGLYPD